MNLHQAKGLEAPVVFLADPTGKWNHEPTLHVNRSEDLVQGYLCISVKRGEHQRELLAHPAQWDTFSAEEQRFQDAEKNRLLYVAATRPGQRLVISQRAKGNGWNPWSPLDRYLADCPAMAFPEPQVITRGPGRKIDADEPVRVSRADFESMGHRTQRQLRHAGRKNHLSHAVQAHAISRGTWYRMGIGDSLIVGNCHP